MTPVNYEWSGALQSILGTYPGSLITLCLHSLFANCASADQPIGADRLIGIAWCGAQKPRTPLNQRANSQELQQVEHPISAKSAPRVPRLLVDDPYVRPLCGNRAVWDRLLARAARSWDSPLSSSLLIGAIKPYKGLKGLKDE